MTRAISNSDEPFTPFSLWLRNLKKPLDSSEVDCTDIDYVWFHYRKGWFITIEEKRWGAYNTVAQTDTQSVLAQMLAFASGMGVDTLRGRRKIFYKGHFVLSFEKTTPDNSTWVRINGTRLENPREAVMTLLETGYPIKQEIQSE